jgi:hypothetical protein
MLHSIHEDAQLQCLMRSAASPLIFGLLRAAQVLDLLEDFRERCSGGDWATGSLELAMTLILSSIKQRVRVPGTGTRYIRVHRTYYSLCIVSDACMCRMLI